jgi:hypothetical protein
MGRGMRLEGIYAATSADDPRGDQRVVAEVRANIDNDVALLQQLVKEARDMGRPCSSPRSGGTTRFARSTTRPRT